MTDNILNQKVIRMVLKDDDVLVITLPSQAFMRKKVALSIYNQIKKALHPRKNKILLLPEDIKLSVIGNDEVEEHVSHIDLWNLFDGDGEEII